MSGGAFDYNQYKISQLADEIEQLILDNGRLKTNEELKDESYRNDEWYEQYPEDLHHYKYPDNVIDEFKNGLRYLRLASIYAQRIDWLVSGDDGEKTFIERLNKELGEIKI